MRRFILSVDGGGIRGAMVAQFLTRLEAKVGKPCSRIFQFSAGTSTGALISAAVAANVPMTRVVSVYRTRTQEIFSPGPPFNQIKRIAKGWMYDVATLRRIVAQTLADPSWPTTSSAPMRLNDCPIDLMITAKQVDDGKQWYFVNDANKPKKRRKITGSLGLIDCATASAAAPTYFQPFSIIPFGKLIDGGVGVAGNPSYHAAVEAFEYDDYVPRETTIVSFGTGISPAPRVPSNVVSWLGWVLDDLLDAPEKEQLQLIRRHYPEAKLARLDAPLAGKIAMDDVSAVPQMIDLGNKLFEATDVGALLA